MDQLSDAGLADGFSVQLAHVDRDTGPATYGVWIKESAWVVPDDVHGRLGGDHTVEWSVTVFSGTPGMGGGTAISPPSETWMFHWG